MAIDKEIIINESGFVFNPQTGESFSLNPMAKEIIMLLQAGLSHKEICNKLHETYDVSMSSLQTDLYDFYYMLEKYGISHKE